MRIVIIGNGVAGMTCALAARRRDPHAEITVVGDETPHFFARTALMYAFMNRMKRHELEPHERSFYREQRIALLHDRVVRVDVEGRVARTRGGARLAWDRLVLAIGARARWPDWTGLDQCRDGVAPFVGMGDLDRWEQLVPDTSRAVVVGGGLIGIELVECLAFHRIRTTFLVRDPWYWPVALGREEAAMVSGALAAHGVELIQNDSVRELVANNNRVAAVRTHGGLELPAQAVGVCIGVEPALDRLPEWDHAPATARGVLVDESFRTSVPDVFAIGDCAEMERTDGPRLVETLWYSARRHGDLLGSAGLFGEPVRYTPPTFFNSSRFFDIEYTTVGSTQDAPEGTPSIRLHDEARGISVRIVHNGQRVLGLNGLGSRWDHEVWMRWIEEQRAPDWVERHLGDSQYDHELGRAALRRLVRTEQPIQRGAA